MGCLACVVACKDWHDIPAGPASWIKVKTVEKGKYPDVSVTFIPQTCYHCINASCISACPVNAIAKQQEYGIVMVDRDICLGKDKCGLCLEACPYDAPQFGAEENAKMQKCDLCLERWTENTKPVCVSSCPVYALDAGPIDELRSKYGHIKSAEGFVYSEKLSPAVIFLPKRPAKNVLSLNNISSEK